MTDRVNLVTGATGFSGAYVVRELLARGEEVVATDLASAIDDEERREVLASIGLDMEAPGVEWIPSDLLDRRSMEALFERDITHIFHIASLYDYSASYEVLRRINVDGTRNLVEVVHEQCDGLEQFIHWSTCGVFGKPYTAADGDKVNIPFGENCSSPKNTPRNAKGPEGTHLVNAYSVSKWEQEKMMWNLYEDEGFPLTVVRPAPIYGPGSSYGHGGIILAIAMGLVPAIPKDAENYITTSVHVEDIAGFAIYAADHPEFIGEDFNVVDNSIISYHEFLNYIALLTGRKMRDIPLVKVTALYPIMARASRVWTWLQKNFGVPRVRVFEVQSAEYISSSYWLSNRKTLEVGYEYRYPDVKEGLKDTVAWFRDMGWLTDSSKTMQSEGVSSKL